jgi:hypothetical protein
VSNEILARDSFEVKICACPGRDRTTDEKKTLKKNKSHVTPLAKAKVKEEVKVVAENIANKNQAEQPS